MTTEIIDDDDWVEIEKATASGAVLPDVQVRISIFKMRERLLKPRVSIVLRREAAQWIRANGPRFRAALGGAKLNFLRLTPDVNAGKFEHTSFKGIEKLIIGHLPAWPSETREPTEAKWSVTDNWLKLELPIDFVAPRPLHSSLAPSPPTRPLSGAPLILAVLQLFTLVTPPLGDLRLIKEKDDRKCMKPSLRRKRSQG